MRGVKCATVLLLLLSSCTPLRKCPAYVTDPVMGGDYDPNAIECSVWYEWLGDYWWATYDKEEALDTWADISSRPMYFNMSSEFTFTVKAKDGYRYSFWSMAMGTDTVYNITASKQKTRAPI